MARLIEKQVGLRREPAGNGRYFKPTQYIMSKERLKCRILRCHMGSVDLEVMNPQSGKATVIQKQRFDRILL